jgi:hypothetical protein
VRRREREMAAAVVLILSRRLGGGVHRRGGSGDGESSTELFVDRRRKTTGEGVGPQLGHAGRGREGRGIGLPAQFGFKPFFFYKTVFSFVFSF